MGRAGEGRAKTGDTALAKEILLASPDASQAEKQSLCREAGGVNLSRLSRQRRRVCRAGEGGDEDGGKGKIAKKRKASVVHNTQFGGYRAAGRFNAPRGETLLRFLPQSIENFMASARARGTAEGWWWARDT